MINDEKNHWGIQRAKKMKTGDNQLKLEGIYAFMLSLAMFSELVRIRKYGVTNWAF
jgi:hypothetical protein